MKKSTNIIPIPKEKLHEGFNECQNKVNDLLKSSQVLFDSGQFIESLALSILAAEETTKLSMIWDHIKKNMAIEAEDWYELTMKRGMHNAKLTKIHKDSIQKIEKMTDGEFQSFPRIKASQKHLSRTNTILQLQESKEMYAKLAKIKNACFYVNWDTDWSTLLTYLPNVQDRKDMAYFHLMLGWYEYYVVIFALKYNIGNFNVRKYTHHPYLKKYIHFNKMIHSNEFFQLFGRVKQIFNEIKL